MVVSFRSTLEIWVALEGSIDKRPVWATGLITSVYRSKCGGWTGGPIAISHRTFESSMCPTRRPCSRDGGTASRRLPGNVAWVLPSHTGLVLSKTSKLHTLAYRNCPDTFVALSRPSLAHDVAPSPTFRRLARQVPALSLRQLDRMPIPQPALASTDPSKDPVSSLLTSTETAISVRPSIGNRSISSRSLPASTHPRVSILIPLHRIPEELVSGVRGLALGSARGNIAVCETDQVPKGGRGVHVWVVGFGLFSSCKRSWVLTLVSLAQIPERSLPRARPHDLLQP